MKTTTIPLRMERVLDYYDVPQLFVARDAFDTLYLCLLYTDEPECRYTAIRISGERLGTFLAGQADLRELLTSPETEGEYFEASLVDGRPTITSRLPPHIGEERLPERGYTLDGGEKENVVVSIPASDRHLLSEIVRKFGWACM